MANVAKRVLAALEPLIREDLELSENVLQGAYQGGRFVVPFVVRVAELEQTGRGG